jgi:hypothetical protein
MAYGNYFPQGYPYYQPMQQTPLQTQTAPSGSMSGGINWIQGIEAAKAYPVAAGSTVLLMDSESSHLYIKTADQSGMPSLRVFEYTEVTGREHAPQKQDAPDMSMYVTHEELEQALAAIAPKKKEAKKNE